MKHLVRFSFLLFLTLAAAFSVKAQSTGARIGEWRVYMPNNSAKAVAAAGNKIYCVTEKGFFYFDKEFNSIKTLSKADGLHDIGISTVEYDPETSTLLVAYQNTNLDLIRGEEIININDILRKAITGVKTINHIYFKDKLAYLSCSFGLVVLDMVKLEIKDSYLFQDTTGSARQVYATTILGDRIFLATSSGVMVARNSRTVNLNDLKNWTLFNTSSGLPAANSGNFRSLATFNNAVYAGVNNVGVYKLNSTANSWNNVFGTPTEINHLVPGHKALLISGRYNFVEYFDASGQAIFYTDKLLSRVMETIQDKDGTFWAATVDFGLVRTDDGITYENIVPNGPLSETSFKILADRESVIVAGGNYTPASQSNSTVGFYEFKNGTWENYNYKRFNDPNLYPEIQDLVDVIRNPVNGKVYFASYGFGLMEWNGPGDYKLWGLNNSPLNTSITGSPQFVRLTAITADED